MGKTSVIFRPEADGVFFRQNRALQCQLLAPLTIMEHLWVPMCVLTICSCNSLATKMGKYTKIPKWRNTPKYQNGQIDQNTKIHGNRNSVLISGKRLKGGKEPFKVIVLPRWNISLLFPIISLLQFLGEKFSYYKSRFLWSIYHTVF